MQTATLLGLIIAALLSFLIVSYQYYYKAKKNRKLQLPLAVLRYVAVFGILVLLINPKIINTAVSLEKQDLIFLWDNSNSIEASNAATQMLRLQQLLKENTSLPERFSVTNYSFGQALNPSDSLSFDEMGTNIAKSLSAVHNLYRNNETPVVLISDGNQTVGEEYKYMGSYLQLPVSAIVVGDTTTYRDLKIGQVNLNKYAFLKNTFPLELFVSYQGQGSINSKLTVQLDGKRVYREDIALDAVGNSKRVNLELEATSTGLKTLVIAMDTITGERNTGNNKRRVPIEIIDEKTKIALISDINHPDIGALVKAIESNNQRSVTILKPEDLDMEGADYDLFLLYQPNRNFAPLYQYIEKTSSNTFTITGIHTDWSFLNRMQKGLERISYGQTEEIVPVLNPAFGLFDLDEFEVTDFPPLSGYLGELLITTPYESIMTQQLKGVSLQEPLMAVLNEGSRREAFLFGENIWKWRVQSFRNDGDFVNFDSFINTLMRYLSSNEKRERLSVSYELYYDGATNKKISAAYFDAAYLFNPDAQLTLAIEGVTNAFSETRPMVLGNKRYETNIGDLPAGEYTFTVTADGGKFIKKGAFEIADFNMEQLFISSNVKDLRQLTETTKGALYFPDQLQLMIDDLMTETRFTPRQKSIENVVSLIDFKLLLGIIIIALTAEWIIRKFNGLT
jgi:hypothetical protein